MSLRNRKKRSIPMLNSTSTADISFMLLIFFLMTSSMEQETGLQHRLPPSDDQKKEESFQDVNADKVLTVTITPEDALLIDGKALKDRDMEEHLRTFITTIGPEHIIEIKAATDANYNSYFHLQNILSRVYNSLREEYAQKTFHKTMAECTSEQRQQVREKYPQRLSEDFCQLSKGH